MYEIICGKNPHRDIDMMSVLNGTDNIQFNSIRSLAADPDLRLDEYEFPVFKGDNIRPWKKYRGELTKLEDLIDFIPLKAKSIVYSPYAEGLAVFKSGLEIAVLTKIIGKHVSPNEIKTILTGQIDYTAQDWRDSCRDNEITPGYDEQLVWFWKAVDEISVEERKALLKYVTALVWLPVGGFSALNYAPSVHFYNSGSLDKLPEAATCFNRIKLFPVSSYDIMKSNLASLSKFNSVFSSA